jgi:saccharopine dehydrogenase-like NADP-dependent oxidoreductase
LGTLCETLAGKVESLNYKTVRYPGHRDIIKMLVQDLRLGQRRGLLKDVLEQAIPATMQDVVLVFIAVNGYKDGLLLQETFAKKIYHNTINGKEWSAIQITTAASICAVLDLLKDNKIPNKGFIKQEQIAFNEFISNRFGQYYA